jgi:hypothetical protein
MATPMELGCFCWPDTPARIRTIAAVAQRSRYDVVGGADTPGVAMAPWVAATLLAEVVTAIPLALCVSHRVSRPPAASISRRGMAWSRRRRRRVSSSSGCTGKWREC